MTEQKAVDDKTVVQAKPEVQGLDALVVQKKQAQKKEREQQRLEMKLKNAQKVSNKPVKNVAKQAPTSEPKKKFGITLQRVYSIVVRGLPKEATPEDVMAMVKQQVHCNCKCNKGGNVWFIELTNENKADELIRSLNGTFCKESNMSLQATYKK